MSGSYVCWGLFDGRVCLSYGTSNIHAPSPFPLVNTPCDYVVRWVVDPYRIEVCCRNTTSDDILDGVRDAIKQTLVDPRLGLIRSTLFSDPIQVVDVDGELCFYTSECIVGVLTTQPTPSLHQLPDHPD